MSASGELGEGAPNVNLRQLGHWIRPPHDEVSFARHPFTKRFLHALHALLTACPRQDVLRHFAHFERRHQEFLYKVFTLIVAQIHENAVAEFRSICGETQILEALDHINNRTLLSAIKISDSIPPKEVVQEATVKRKLQEVDIMKRRLQQINEENAQVAAQLEEIRLKVGEARDLGSVDAVIDEVRNINLMLSGKT